MADAAERLLAKLEARVQEVEQDEAAAQRMRDVEERLRRMEREVNDTSKHTQEQRKFAPEYRDIIKTLQRRLQQEREAQAGH